MQKKEKEKKKGGGKGQEYVTEPICGLQNLKYLLSVPLQKKFADPCFKQRKTGYFFAFL